MADETATEGGIPNREVRLVPLVCVAAGVRKEPSLPVVGGAVAGAPKSQPQAGQSARWHPSPRRGGARQIAPPAYIAVMTDEIAGHENSPSQVSRLLGRLPRPLRLAGLVALSAAAGALLMGGHTKSSEAAGLPACHRAPSPATPRGGSLSTSWLAPLPTDTVDKGLTSWQAHISTAGLPGAGSRTKVSWIGSHWAGVNSAIIELTNAQDDAVPMGLQLETSDSIGSDLTALYFTEPLPHQTSTAGLRFQAPLPWLRLDPYQSSLAYTVDCRRRVIVTRPDSRPRWELRVSDNPSAGRFRHYFTVTALTLETDTVKPPFHSIHLEITVTGEGRQANVTATAPTR